MHIKPYKSIDSLQFKKSTKSDCVRLYGEPQNVRKNRYDVEEYYYKDFIVRFDPETGTLQECTLLPSASAVVDEIPVTWDRNFLIAACKEDGHPLEVYGFVVMAKLGIAVTGIHDDDPSQLALTAFAKGLFNDLLNNGQAFDIPVT